MMKDIKIIRHMILFLLIAIRGFLNLFTRYLLMPFAWLTIEIHGIQEETKNKVVYYLISIPYVLTFPFTLIWLILCLWEIDINTYIKNIINS
jgi:hypothetical protein